MSKKESKTYISHRFKDESNANNHKRFFKIGGGEIKSQPVRVKVDAKSKEQIDKAIREKMKECDTVLFVNERDSHSSEWQRREAELAISMNKKIVITESPGSKGGVQPELKDVKKTQKVKWKQRDLKDAIEKNPNKNITNKVRRGNSS